jgi:2,5-diketo-D-gluconate reductase B
MEVPFVNINDGVAMPVIGLGTWKLQGVICKKAVYSALEAGYRHFDTALSYQNHREIGEAIEAFGIERKELFIVSKIPSSQLRADSVVMGCRQALQELRTSYLDLFLIHWPNSSIPIVETLTALNELKNEGLIRALGVSNFDITDIEEILLLEREMGISFNVANNQIEVHPAKYEKDLIEYCQRNNIAVTAYSPLDQGDALDIEEIQEISNKHNKPPSQIIVNWILSRGMIAIPASSKPEHITENLHALDWKLDSEDLKKLDNISERMQSTRFL